MIEARTVTKDCADTRANVARLDRTEHLDDLEHLGHLDHLDPREKEA